MGLFRRHPKPDRGTPVTPPDGLKWVLSRSKFTHDPRLDLWPVSTTVNEWGIDEKGGSRPLQCLFVDADRLHLDLRVTSECLLAWHRRDLATERSIADAQLAVERANR